MVGAVHLRMAVQTTLDAEELTGNSGTVVADAGMSGRRMALLAQLRWPLLQQRLKIRSVTAMTDGAVFGRGFVFPQKGTALLCMT